MSSKTKTRIIFEFIWDLIKVACISLAIIIPVRYFLIQPFYVKGASMEPNFYDHEYLIIDEISYRFTGRSLGLVTTKNTDRGRAKIYIDGRYAGIVDAHSVKRRPRQLIFYRSWKKKRTHYIKVVNLGTPGRARFDIDGLAVGR